VFDQCHLSVATGSELLLAAVRAAVPERLQITHWADKEDTVGEEGSFPRLVEFRLEAGLC
jgi:hypothetical protein